MGSQVPLSCLHRQFGQSRVQESVCGREQQSLHVWNIEFNSVCVCWTYFSPGLIVVTISRLPRVDAGETSRGVVVAEGLAGEVRRGLVRDPAVVFLGGGKGVLIAVDNSCNVCHTAWPQCPRRSAAKIRLGSAYLRASF